MAYLRDRIIIRTRIDFTRTTYYYNSVMEVHLKCQKNREKWKRLSLRTDGCSNHKKVHIGITPIRQSPERLQSHFIVKTFQRVLKTQS